MKIEFCTGKTGKLPLFSFNFCLSYGSSYEEKGDSVLFEEYLKKAKAYDDQSIKNFEEGKVW